MYVATMKCMYRYTGFVYVTIGYAFIIKIGDNTLYKMGLATQD